MTGPRLPFEKWYSLFVAFPLNSAAASRAKMTRPPVAFRRRLIRPTAEYMYVRTPDQHWILWDVATPVTLGFPATRLLWYREQHEVSDRVRACNRLASQSLDPATADDRSRWREQLSLHGSDGRDAAPQADAPESARAVGAASREPPRILRRRPRAGARRRGSRHRNKGPKRRSDRKDGNQTCEDAGAPKGSWIGRDVRRRCEERSRHLHGQGRSGRRTRSGDECRFGDPFSQLEPQFSSDDCPIPSCLEDHRRTLRSRSPAEALAASEETTAFFLIRFVATDVFDYHLPSRCRLRVHLRAHGVAEARPGPFEATLRRLGKEHEARHLEALAASTDVADLSAIPDRRERERETRRLLSEGAPAISQGRLGAVVDLDGEECEIVGEPDFLIRTAVGHLIRDSKLARTIDGDRHPEIRLQLQLYGFLYERLLGRPPAALQVHAGSGELVPVAYDGGGAALGCLRFLHSLRAAATEPYEPVGWSKCGGCGFRERCWTRAQESQDVALLSTVNQGLARELAARGVRSVDQLLSSFDEGSLAVVRYGDGRRRRLVGGSAGPILRSARVLSSSKEESIARADLPDPQDCVLFDLEACPLTSMT